ncbi:DNA-binding protein [Aerophototrophica crusticola]|uniref:DNA-binding protein n=1 Tax=Aerophototrophica crusticola TaxID=1709002 RepID=A0A858R808_9PROT|nr:DNA-binding protein [Rhodospirillaceae bacterium B3]
MTWEFILKFRLPPDGTAPAGWLDALYEAGCDDATVGVGKPGTIALDFSREADSAEAAVRSAIKDVERAIPGAVLAEVGPDLVNLADLGEITGCSRQNIRKYAAGEIKAAKAPFPEPVHTGNPSLWRLAEVLPWFHRNTDLRPDPALLELARVTSAMNLDIQRQRLNHLLAAE